MRSAVEDLTSTGSSRTGFSNVRSSFVRSSTATMVALTLVGSDAWAQPGAEPIAIAYDAPAACPDGDAFFREIAARTTRARAARPGEHARVLHIAIVKGPDAFTGRLLIEETASWSSAREVQGATCVEVVEALGLIAALAVDPKASTAPRAVAVAPAPAAVGATAVPPPPPATTTAASQEPSEPASGRREAPSSSKRAPADRESRMRFAVGAQVEGTAIADVVLSGRLFGEVELGDRGRSILAPAVRLTLARSLDVDRTPSIGAASLRWTQAGLEGCPLRFPIATTLAVRPCAGVSGGALTAEGTGVGAARSRTRPWVSVFAHGRFVWEPTAALAVELEAGAVMPLYRETFFFEPSVPVYEAPILAFLGRAGVALRFP